MNKEEFEDLVFKIKKEKLINKILQLEKELEDLCIVHSRKKNERVSLQ